MNKNISFDIDGILNNYPKCFLDYCSIFHGIKVESLMELKNSLRTDFDYSHLKKCYRESDYKYNLPIDINIANAIRKLSLKNNVYILTSRPFNDYPEMFKRTSDWLKNNNIEYKELLSKNIYNLNDKNIELHVDDDIGHIASLINNTVTKFVLIKEGVNLGGSESRIIFCPEKHLILDFIENVNSPKIKTI